LAARDAISSSFVAALMSGLRRKCSVLSAQFSVKSLCELDLITDH